MVKNPPANAGDARDMGSIASGEGKGNLFQFSCLGNPMDSGALEGYSPRGHKESDKTGHISHSFNQSFWVLYTSFAMK